MCVCAPVWVSVFMCVSVCVSACICFVSLCVSASGHVCLWVCASVCAAVYARHSIVRSNPLPSASQISFSSTWNPLALLLKQTATSLQNKNQITWRAQTKSTLWPNIENTEIFPGKPHSRRRQTDRLAWVSLACTSFPPPATPFASKRVLTPVCPIHSPHLPGNVSISI